MRCLIFAITTVLSFTGQAPASTNVASRIDHTIIKEPQYQSTPKYCLITVGNGTKVWMVEDGKRLFVDKNANGDLTDDGPPIEPSNVRNLDANSRDFKYVLDAITPTNGPRHTRFVLNRWNYNQKEDEYGLSLWVDGDLPMYAGWFGTFWSTSRETAPVVHFGGPFTPHLLRRKEFTIGEKGQRLSVCFMNPTPVLNIEWPTASGGAPLQTSHQLTQRCCYWEFYTTQFEVPNGVIPGRAKVSIDLIASALPIELTTTDTKCRGRTTAQG